MISVDPTKVQFTTTDQVDKVIVYSSNNASSSGLGVNGYMDVTAPANPVLGEDFVASIPNPYGRKCLPTVSWSIDQVTYTPGNEPIYYFNAVASSYLWQALISMGCSDDNIYFYVRSQYDAAQRIYFQFALDSVS